MPKDYSPFTPGLPVSAEFFVGRLQEVRNLVDKADAATRGRLQCAFLIGERGIGKSSLAAYARYVAEIKHGVVGLHTFLGGVGKLPEMVRRVFDRLLKDSLRQGWQRKILDFFGRYVRQIDLFGISVEFEAGQQDLLRLVNDFAPTLRNLYAKLRDEKNALLLILDDINGLTSSEEFAHWLKSLVDEIATAREPLPLCLILVGLEERRRSLINAQPSLARVFDIIEIQPWSPQETREFFLKAFATVSVSVIEEAADVLVRYSGGLPMLAHEIGDQVFKTDTDGRIDPSDAWRGICAAADIVGRKFLEPQVFQAIRSPRYREILRKIAGGPPGIRFTRAQLRERLSPDERRVLDNFLTRMKTLGVIQTDPAGGPGAYRFSNHLHHLYFALEAAREPSSPPGA